ncbi:hypothetical protein EX30DRAFT_397489 [Ascodesmis nigricans]|uniref:Protein kinase domain-containing protein n=1 Tax=Ascodesmis nigricans TaxID=341454 RepID=A0A4V3SI58_9PEZI|nr:hypothetical protein EX30DRAFT_397489 [Ascodesmis nigricans]
MEAVGFAFGTIQMVGTCIKTGNFLTAAYDSYTESEKELAEHRQKLRQEWVNIQLFLECLKKLYPTLEPSHQECFDNSIKTLENKLQTAIARVSRLKKGDSEGIARLKKLRYALTLKARITEDLRSLSEWQQGLQPTIMMMTLANTRELDGKIAECESSSGGGVGRQLAVIRELRMISRAPGTTTEKSAMAWKMSESDIIPSTVGSIFFSSVQVATARCPGRSSIVPVILNSLNIGTRVNPQEFTQDAYELVSVLSKGEPTTFGMLRCCGFIPRNLVAPVHQYGGSLPTQFDLLFEFPDNMTEPKSLRALLNESVEAPLPSPRQRYSLGARLRLAKQLARSVAFVHACNMVHKKIRPECVLVFQSVNSPHRIHRSQSEPVHHRHQNRFSQQNNNNNNNNNNQLATNPTSTAEVDTIGTPFLIGFESTRRTNTATLLSPPPASSPLSPAFDPQDAKWHRTLYQHPRRRGTHPDERYSIDHDMYSLGVCLLELGLWTSFVVRAPNRNSNAPGPVLVEEGIDGIVTGRPGAVASGLTPTARSSTGLALPPPPSPPKVPLGATTATGPGMGLGMETRESADAVRNALILVARRRLPAVVGERYTDVVVTCLEGFGGGEEGDGVEKGVLFIEMVLQKLEEIVV